ncbi:MAG: alkaline phosphatase family protein [Propionibacteriaceae bacterium]|nr:alkaline phosphatase family protein [Propionibacteriaceae bacterium]
MSSPVLPDYAGRCLTSLLPAIGARCGLAGRTDRLGLPPARGYVVLLVDGLGYHQLRSYGDSTAYLGGLLGGHEPLTCGVPSTTATSLTSLGTGRAPGEHGLVGYRFRNPGNGLAMNALSWENGPDDVASFQPFEPLYGEFGRACCVAPARFHDTALTRAGMTGARFSGIADECDLDERIDAVRAAAEASQVVYVYERVLDHTGHGHGVGSWRWLNALAWVDELAESIRAACPRDVCLIVTGDHGMVNVDDNQYLIVEDIPELGGYDLLAGEARFRHVYCARPAELAARWREVLGDRAWVATREDALASGWFGPLAPGVGERLGDVMVAMRDQWVLMSRTHPVEMGLRGVHGSLTPDEMCVPLLIDGPR